MTFTHSPGPGSLGEGKLVFQNAVERLDPCRFNPTSLNNCGTTSTQTFFGYRYRPVSGQTSPGRWLPRLTATSGA